MSGMDVFDDVQKRMLGKEWLARVDNEASTPYLLKFHADESESTCSIMITDTRSIWFETLTSNQLARRWRECNPLKTKSNLTSREEELWRGDVIKCLSTAHTIGNFAEMSFDVVKSLYSDFAFELRLEDFAFRWETNTAGHRISAQVISTQIIMPLMSAAHLAFSSPNPIGEMSGSELEAALDKLGRAARRTPGMHARNAISRPRLATAIRRMTAMLNFLVELPNIQLDVEKLDITSPNSAPVTTTAGVENEERSPVAVADIEMGEPPAPNTERKNMHEWLEPTATKSQHQSLDMHRAGSSQIRPEDDSATENSDDEQPILEPASPTKAPTTRSSALVDGKRVDHSTSNLKPLKGTKEPAIGTAASEPSPPPARPPTKRAKQVVSSPSNSEESDEVAAVPSTRRGARQPIKRGGKRF